MEAVFLANYFHEHTPYVIKCFEKGIHVLCECITNGTMAEGVELLRSFEKSSSIFMLAENYPQMKFNREMKRKGKLWIRVFPDKPVTRKPIEVRMGGGKGNPEFWAAVILPGKVLFEVGGVSEEVAKECLRLAATKIGIHTKFITRAGVKI